MTNVNERDLLEVELFWSYLFIKKVTNEKRYAFNFELCENFVKDLDCQYSKFLKTLDLGLYHQFQYTMEDLKVAKNKIYEYESKFLGYKRFKTEIEHEKWLIGKCEKFISENQDKFEEIKRYMYNNEYGTTNFYLDNSQEKIKDIKITKTTYVECFNNLCSQNSIYEKNKPMIENYTKDITVNDYQIENQFVLDGEKREKLIENYGNVRKLLINSLKIIPEYYCTEEAISTMLWYFINRRGDSIKELINLYEQEKWQNEMLRINQNIVSSIDKINDNISHKFADLASKLDCIKYDLNKGIELCTDKINKSIDNNTKHYLKIVDLINDVNRNNIKYNEKLIELIKEKNTENSYEIVFDSNRY